MPVELDDELDDAALLLLELDKEELLELLELELEDDELEEACEPVEPALLVECEPVVPVPELLLREPEEPELACEPVEPEPAVELATWMPVVPPVLLDACEPVPEVAPLVAAEVFGTHWPLLLQPVPAASQSESVPHSITHALALQRPSVQSES